MGERWSKVCQCGPQAPRALRSLLVFLRPRVEIHHHLPSLHAGPAVHVAVLLHVAPEPVKQLKMRPNTDVHDYNVRLKRAKQFLGKGNKVKITVVFSGRDMAYKDKGRELLDRFR